MAVNEVQILDVDKEGSLNLDASSNEGGGRKSRDEFGYLDDHLGIKEGNTIKDFLEKSSVTESVDLGRASRTPKSPRNEGPLSPRTFTNQLSSANKKEESADDYQ